MMYNTIWLIIIMEAAFDHSSFYSLSNSYYEPEYEIYSVLTIFGNWLFLTSLFFTLNKVEKVLSFSSKLMMGGSLNLLKARSIAWLLPSSWISGWLFLNLICYLLRVAFMIASNSILSELSTFSWIWYSMYLRTTGLHNSPLKSISSLIAF